MRRAQALFLLGVPLVSASLFFLACGGGGGGGAGGTTTGHGGSGSTSASGGAGGTTITGYGGTAAGGADGGGTTSSSGGTGGTTTNGCQGKVCNTPPSACFGASGTCVNGSCTYPFADGVACDDGNPCTTGDACASGTCVGTPMVCNDTPPPPTCASAMTLATYGANGSCVGGTCEYPATYMTCAGSCANGACSAVVAISPGGADHTCAIVSGGAAKCWGKSTNGELGNISPYSSLVDVPIDVTGIASGATAIGTGAGFSCALVSGGVKCWGDNTYGQLGNNSTQKSMVPVDVVGLGSGVSAISVGYRHVCALVFGGVKCWGRNTSGQLGNNSTQNSLVPVDVWGLGPSGSLVTAISVGGAHSCALLQSTGVKCWGSGAYGQIGNVLYMNTVAKTPQDVDTLTSGVAAISAGGRHTCALVKATGGLKCWGDDSSHQLGQLLDTLTAPVPVDVPALTSGVTAVSAGGDNTCALVSGGVKCWGDNYYGQVGDGSTSSLSGESPVDVVGLGSGVTAVSTGTNHTCALLENGAAKCWGDNTNGQLGNAAPSFSSPTPVTVANIP